MKGGRKESRHWSIGISGKGDKVEREKGKSIEWGPTKTSSPVARYTPSNNSSDAKEHNPETQDPENGRY